MAKIKQKYPYYAGIFEYSPLKPLPTSPCERRGTPQSDSELEVSPFATRREREVREAI
jgi:hypothetical protein